MGKENPGRAEYLCGKLSSPQPHPSASPVDEPTHPQGKPNQTERGLSTKLPYKQGLGCGEKEFLEVPKAELFLQKSQEFLQQTSWPVLMSSKCTVRGSVGVRELSCLKFSLRNS